MVLYNLDKLIKIEISDFTISKRYSFNGRKDKWKPWKKVGFYDRYLSQPYLGMKLPEGHIVIDDVVYRKPCVDMYFQGDVFLRKYFEKQDDAASYVEFIAKEGRWTHEE